MSALRQLKLGALSGARGLGAFGRVQRSAWRRERLLILAYHGVSIEREHEWDSGLHMAPELLRARLEAIRRSGLRVLPLGEAVERLRRGGLAEPSVVLTFDDGFHDFYRVAAPLLAEYGYPATVYLTTYYVDDQRPLPNLIAPYMLWQKRNAGLEVGEGLWDGRPEPLTPESWSAVAERIRLFAQEKDFSADRKDEAVQRLAEQLGFDYDAVRSSRVLSLMNAGEVRELARAGVDFQLHTHRHRTPNDEALFLRELRDNRARIEELTGRPADHFCYPSGVYRMEFLPWLRAEEVISATTCDAGLCRADAEPLLLPRKVDTGCVTGVEFDAWLSGCEPLLRPWL